MKMNCQIQKMKRIAYVSDLVWPFVKIDEGEYSKYFNLQLF